MPANGPGHVHILPISPSPPSHSPATATQPRQTTSPSSPRSTQHRLQTIRRCPWLVVDQGECCCFCGVVAIDMDMDMCVGSVGVVPFSFSFSVHPRHSRRQTKHVRWPQPSQLASEFRSTFRRGFRWQIWHGAVNDWEVM